MTVLAISQIERERARGIMSALDEHSDRTYIERPPTAQIATSGTNDASPSCSMKPLSGVYALKTAAVPTQLAMVLDCGLIFVVSTGTPCLRKYLWMKTTLQPILSAMLTMFPMTRPLA